MHMDPLDVLDTTCLHAPALILDTGIGNRASAIVVDLAGHVERQVEREGEGPTLQQLATPLACDVAITQAWQIDPSQLFHPHVEEP